MTVQRRLTLHPVILAIVNQKPILATSFKTIIQ